MPSAIRSSERVEVSSAARMTRRQFAVTALGTLAALPTRRVPAFGASRPARVVRWGLFKTYQPVFIAHEKKLFARHGVAVEMIGAFISGPAVVQAAAVRQVDAGHSAISGIVNAVHGGIPVLGVADSQTEFRDAPLMQWFVLAGSPIHSAADLRGRRIAVNSLSGSFYYTLLIYLRRHQMAKSDVQFLVIPHHNQEQALRTRQIDVAGLIDPYAVHIQKGGGVRTLFRAVDIIGEVQFSHVFVRKELAVGNPDTVRRFVDGYVDAITFIAEHPAEASEIIARATGVAADLHGVHRYTPGAEVRLQDCRFWMELMRKAGELRDDGRLRPEDVATTAFVRGA